MFFLKGYKKQLRKIFEKAGYYIPQEEKKLLSEQAVKREEEEKKEENGQFDTLLKCTEVITCNLFTNHSELDYYNVNTCTTTFHFL